MTPQQTIKLINKLLKQKQKDFGKGCKTVDIACASCQARRLEDYLNWYKEILEWSIKEDK